MELIGCLEHCLALLFKELKKFRFLGEKKSDYVIHRLRKRQKTLKRHNLEIVSDKGGWGKDTILRLRTPIKMFSRLINKEKNGF